MTLLASQYFYVNDTMTHLEVTSLTRVVKPESCPVMTSAPSLHIPTQNHQFNFPYEWLHIIQRLEWFCNCSVDWQQSAHNISSSTSFWKRYLTKTNIVALLSALVDWSTWTAYHVWLINSNSCASISSYHFINLSSYSTILKRNVCNLLNCSLF